jgi:penicillin-binding protein 1A
LARSRTVSARRAPARPKVSEELWRQLRWLLTGPVGLLVLIVGVGWYVSLDIDDLRRPAGSSQPSITLLDHEGAQFAQLGNRYGEYLELEQISPWVQKAVIAAEDRRFYSHPGIDPIGIARALVRNLQAGEIVQGGSTISQQLAKLAFLTPERSISRKIKEALYTLWLEARFDKKEILEAYLNRVYLGAGVYGIDAAAARYFDKPASELTLAESAMLAGLIRAPSRYAPTRDLELARQRAAAVLEDMEDAGQATSAEVAAAMAAPAALARPEIRADSGYFADWVVAETRLYAGPEQQRLEVATTLDQNLQNAAEQALRGAMEQWGAQLGASQAALVAMTPDGEVRAMLGGRSYAETQFNRATQAERQPGSAFKLFVYLTALEAGFLPSDTISGAPIEVGNWRPANFNDRYPSRLTLTDSFADSVNTAAVRLSEEIGREDVIAMAEGLGITSPLRSHPSIALGTSEVSLLELTAAYATVANGGRLVWPQGIETVRGGKCETLYQSRSVDEPVLEPATVRAMTAMLETTMSRGTGQQGSLRRFVAGKTGTSADHRDALFVGFTEDIVVGVWVGNDDGTPMRRVTGGGLPARIFRDFIVRAYGERPFLPDPAPSKPAPGEYPLAVVKEVIGDAFESLLDSLAGLVGD